MTREFLTGYTPTHAWVLPTTGESTQRFAILWNGVVYPISSVGVVADFRQDVVAALQEDTTVRENLKRRGVDFPGRPTLPAFSEQHQRISPLMAGLLLRLGAVDLAERVWATWAAEMSTNDEADLKDPYLLLAKGWVHSLSDLVSTAQEHGYYQIALSTGRALMQIQKSVDDEAEKRGFAHAYFGFDQRYNWSFLPFLNSLPKHLAEIEVYDYFTGDSLPMPPQQQSSWAPPKTKLPQALVSATTRLFEQGLADPRGCEYREVEVISGSRMQGSIIVKTHAWVLPAAGQSTQRFAVGWDGLVYPTISVGAEADLQQDLTAATRTHGMVGDQRFNPATAVWASSSDFAFSVSYQSLSPLMASLFLRLGETNLAERVWSAWSYRMSVRMSGNERAGLIDPYLMLARGWLAALYDRAILAHVRGDDRLALITARVLTLLQRSLDEEAVKRGFGPTYLADPNRSFFTFLGSLPTFLADQETRAREGNQGLRVAPLPAGADKAARIAAYIRGLDQPSLNPAKPERQPGGNDQTLIELGNDLVEPLLTAVESDPRLARSWPALGRPTDRPPLVAVHQVAYGKLVTLLETSNFGVLDAGTEMQSMAGRRRLAAEIRSYFKKYVSFGPTERWYQLLADDSATEDQWLEAAGKIREPLRRKASPSVSQLLLQRMNETHLDATVSTKLGSIAAAGSFALALAQWDGAHYREELRQVSEKLRALSVADSGGTQYQTLMLSLYSRRTEIPDSGALREYADWVLTVKPDATGSLDERTLLGLACRHPDDPAVIAMMDRVFGDPNSAWVPIIRKSPNRYGSGRPIGSELLAPPLLAFAAFRGQVIKALMDKSVVGTLQPVKPAGDYYTWTIEKEVAAALPSAAVSIDPKDPYLPPKPLQPVKFRTCDVYASWLRWIGGAPEFKAYWSEAQRDAAIDALAAFLRDHKGPFVNRF